MNYKTIKTNLRDSGGFFHNKPVGFELRDFIRTHSL